MYHLNHRVKYSETSTNKYVNLAQVINYLQDCSTLESITVGDTLERMEELKYAWLLAAWHIEIERYPELAEEIVISSWHCGHKGLLAERNFDICDKQGNQIVKANSIWFYFDVEKKIPKRIMPEYVDMYGHWEKLPMEEKPRKIKLPDAPGREEKSIFVRKADLDTNGHVNNAKYIEMALEYIEDAGRICSMRADYRKSAVYGDHIVPIIYEEKNQIFIEFRNEAQEIFVIIEFELKE